MSLADTERSDDVDGAREAALKLLDRARRTRQDLSRRLRDKGFAAPAIETALERLAAVGLVDDAEYARAWLAGRWGRRPSGWRRLQQELRVKVCRTRRSRSARAELTARDDAPDEESAARKVVEQAMRRMARLEPRVRQQRLYGLLARRGFDGDLIRRVLAVARLE